MIAARPCPACLSPTSVAAGAVSGFPMRRCHGCGTLFTARLPDPAEAEHYEGYYHAGNLEIPAFVERRLGEVVAGFERYRTGGRWLDVGCGAGALMRAAAEHGWTAVGTEVAPRAAEAVREQGFEVHLGELDALRLPDGSFDVVSLVEVVEHVPDPRGLTLRAGRLLRPGGALYLTTPNARGISARALRNRWSAVAPPEHLQLFSLGGLVATLTHAGLRPLDVRTHAVNPHELLAACRRRSHPDAATRVETGYRLNEALTGNPLGAVAKNAANAVLSGLRLGDAIKLVGERSGRA
jgi:2-polyprenyl-3-methyl-5-hydroxy-6-metoxy-1,4-benzoquinol methylase